MEYFWSITCPKKEGKICIIFSKYLFSLKRSTDGEPNVFEARSESPKIQEVNHFFLAKYTSKKVKKQKKNGSYHVNIKDRHLVYEFFDTSLGGYHPQMEPVVNTTILKSIERNMVEKK